MSVENVASNMTMQMLHYIKKSSYNVLLQIYPNNSLKVRLEAKSRAVPELTQNTPMVVAEVNQDVHKKEMSATIVDCRMRLL